MHIYRCFFLNGDGHIKAAEVIEAEKIQDVIDQACSLLTRHIQTIERLALT